MTTRNDGRCTVATRGRGTNEHDGREGESSRDQVRSVRGSQGGGRGVQGSGRGSQGDGRDGQDSDQGSQGSNRGNRANGGGGGVPDFATLIAQQLQNLLPTIVAQIIVSSMTTRNDGRCTVATRGRGTNEHDGREGESSRDQVRSVRGSQGGGRGVQGSGRGSQGDGRDGQDSDQGSQGSNRGNRANGGGGGVPDFATLIAQQLQNLLPTIVAQVGNHDPFLYTYININTKRKSTL
nr:hypothetical protein [Tanacetum cinerariifolium]